MAEVGSVRSDVEQLRLVDPIVEQLENRHVANTQGVNKTNGPYTTGRYVNMHDRRLGLWLGVDFELWRDAETTPLWWEMHSDAKDDWMGVKRIWDELEKMFDDIQAKDKGRWKCLPIRLKTGVEKDAVIADAADQMVVIAERLVKAKAALRL